MRGTRCWNNQGRIQDFKLGGGAVKKIAPSGGWRQKNWGISCEKSRFYANFFFSNYRGARAVSAPLDPSLITFIRYAQGQNIS
jgi:hypothetical protein